MVKANGNASEQMVSSRWIVTTGNGLTVMVTQFVLSQHAVPFWVEVTINLKYFVTVIAPGEYVLFVAPPMLLHGPLQPVVFDCHWYETVPSPLDPAFVSAFGDSP